MSPTQARTFHAVASAGSFTAAARELHVSQPTVTTQIKELERQYDVELFWRHARGVTLTPTGEELLKIVRRIDASQRDAMEFLLAAQGLRTGHLRIGAYGTQDVIKILGEFTRRYPEPDVTVSIENSMTLQEQLLDHRLDVALFTRSESSLEFYAVPFKLQSHQILIIDKAHPWRRRRSVRVEELSTQTLIIREPGSESRRATEQILRQAGTPPKKIIQIGNRDGVLAAVAEGIGVSTLYDEGFIPEDAVTKIALIGTETSSHVEVVCLAERRKTRLIAAVFEIAEELRSRDG